MHVTATIDLIYIISGEIWLALDDGCEIHLRAGETVVQNGTRHTWHNKTNAPCQLAYVQLGAHQRAIHPRTMLP